MDGSMIDMPAMGAANWPAPTYDPQTELRAGSARGPRHPAHSRATRSRRRAFRFLSTDQSLGANERNRADWDT